MSKKNRFSDLTDQQLVGANFALRVIQTSPVMRGQALALIDEFVQETEYEIDRRNKQTPEERDRDKRKQVSSIISRVLKAKQ